jgi:hypothetical protein
VERFWPFWSPPRTEVTPKREKTLVAARRSPFRREKPCSRLLRGLQACNFFKLEEALANTIPGSRAIDGTPRAWLEAARTDPQNASSPRPEGLLWHALCSTLARVVGRQSAREVRNAHRVALLPAWVAHPCSSASRRLQMRSVWQARTGPRRHGLRRELPAVSPILDVRRSSESAGPPSALALVVKESQVSASTFPREAQGRTRRGGIDRGRGWAVAQSMEPEPPWEASCPAPIESGALWAHGLHVLSLAGPF